MKKKNKKYLKAIISFGVGAVVLTGAVFANYENAGGYSVCKTALKRLAYADNFSVDHTIEVELDSVPFVKEWGSYKVNGNANPCHSSESTYVDYMGDTTFTKTTYQDDMRIFQYNLDDDVSGYISDGYSKPTSLVKEISGTSDTGEKLIDFIETLSDTLIGDLKNSFVLVSDENDIRTFNVSLSKDQLPSYVTAGVNLLTSVIKNDNTYADDAEELADDPFLSLFGSGEPYVKEVNATMSVDKDGNPVQAVGTAVVVGYDRDGREHSINMNMSFDFYDFGKTAIDRVTDEEIAKLSDHRAFLDEKATEAYDE